MALVKTKIFQRTLTHVGPADIENLIEAVEVLANQFTAALPAASVLDIQSVLSPLGKYGAFVHYQLRVTYLVP
mgnify:CR=1 FL=1